jgi:adenylylsulfate kinase-like enzyme
MGDSGLAVVINGLPGSGKSTIARRLVATRPGWFLLDVDVLRTFVGGWSLDFGEAGRIIRPIAQGIVSEVVASGGVVALAVQLATVATGGRAGSRLGASKGWSPCWDHPFDGPEVSW